MDFIKKRMINDFGRRGGVRTTILPLLLQTYLPTNPSTYVPIENIYTISFTFRGNRPGWIKILSSLSLVWHPTLLVVQKYPFCDFDLEPRPHRPGPFSFQQSRFLWNVSETSQPWRQYWGVDGIHSSPGVPDPSRGASESIKNVVGTLSPSS